MSKTNQILSRHIDTYLSWIRSQAIPCWSNQGLDAEGAAYERLLSNGQADSNSDRRVRVQARQMFVFSAAQSNGWISNGLDIISDLDQYVHNYASTHDSAIFAHILDKNNQVINESHDLYDVAFFLLAYAWRYHVFNDLKALDYANKLLQQINADLKGLAGGWQEGSYSHKYRRQNPHMHLFEAFLTLYSVTKDGKWLAKAGEIFALFENTFFDPNNMVILEFFDQDWSPAQDEKGSIVEPGHMLEWVWLLRQYSLLTATPVENYCQSLYHTAMKHGVDKSSNLLFDEITPTGEVVKRTKRCWPMTEWIKAALIQASYAKDNTQYSYQADAIKALESLTLHYIKPAVSGCYLDQIGADNQVISKYSPSSTLYHLVLAGLEGQRFMQGKKNVF